MIKPAVRVFPLMLAMLLVPACASTAAGSGAGSSQVQVKQVELSGTDPCSLFDDAALDELSLRRTVGEDTTATQCEYKISALPGVDSLVMFGPGKTSAELEQALSTPDRSTTRRDVTVAGVQALELR